MADGARGAGGERRRRARRSRGRLHAHAGRVAARSWWPTGAGPPASPTASSSRRRTTRPRTAASSTTRPTAARPTPTSRAGSRTRRTGSSRRPARTGWPGSGASPSSVPGPRPPGTTSGARTSRTSPTWSTWRRSPASGLRIGVDPLGGAAVAYWAAIGERYGLDLTVTNDAVDPAFGFMTLDWDGQHPDGPLVAVRDGAAGGAARPLRPGARQRRRRGPARRSWCRAPG